MEANPIFEQSLDIYHKARRGRCYLVEVVRVVEGPPPEGGRRVGRHLTEDLGLHVKGKEDSLEV